MNTAEIAGMVKDPTGAVIAGAAVEATHILTQQKFSTNTSESGLFLLPQLPLGDYALTVSVAGFKQVVQQHILLHVGDHLRQDFELALGEQTETVTVEGIAPPSFKCSPPKLKTSFRASKSPPYPTRDASLWN